MMPVKVSTLARDETTEIALYISEDNPEAALRWLDAIEQAYFRIAEQPHSGHVRPDLAADQSELRSWVVADNYVILYEVHAKHVEILRVVSGHRDIDALLNG